jgi:uncharacterized membrane protein YhaH (DUF805 family)
MDFKRFFSKFEGRTNGAEYWRAILETAVSCVLFLLIFKTGVKLVQAGYLAVSGHPLPFDFGFSDVLLLYAGWNGEFVAAITIKRLHDRNRSGWWIVPIVMVPALLYRPSDWLHNPALAYLVDFIAFGLGAWCVIELCLPGTRGANRFGADPGAPRKTQWVERSSIEPAPLSFGPPPAWLVKRKHDSASADPCCGQ